VDARGLVAIILTVHEVALALGGLCAAFAGLASLLVFRNKSTRVRTASSLTIALAMGVLSYVVGARLADVRPVSVEVVRIAE
jgi:hypothetical protein